MPLDYSTPKQRFVKSTAAVEAHRFIVSHAQFDNSIDTALAEMTDELFRSMPESVHEGASLAYAVAGVQRFIKIFKNLSEAVEPPKHQAIAPGLRHDT